MKNVKQICLGLLFLASSLILGCGGGGNNNMGSSSASCIDSENFGLQFTVGISCSPNNGFGPVSDGNDPTDPNAPGGAVADSIIMDADCNRIEGETIQVSFGSAVTYASDNQIDPLDLTGDTVTSGIQGTRVVFQCDDLANNQCFVTFTTDASNVNGQTTCTVGYNS